MDGEITMAHFNNFLSLSLIFTLSFSMSFVFAYKNEDMTRYDHHPDNEHQIHENKKKHSVQLGPRPFFLVEDMDDSALKKTLQQCAKGPFYKTDFSIGHRGAALQFPEHSKESYEAAARLGAGILECDVTFTRDQELVCRHSQCDLHTTTNILATALAKKCSVPPDFSSNKPFANVQCCTSDITLAEFKTLKAKMDAGNPNANTLQEYMNATPNWRTDLYSASATVLSHAESIALFKQLGVKMTPELKAPNIEMPFNGFTQQAYAQKLIDEYKTAGVKPKDVYAQSLNLDDVLYWIANEPKFGKQAVFLENMDSEADLPAAIARLSTFPGESIRIVAPPLWGLVTLNKSNEIIPSKYAKIAKALGLDIITWTLERSGLLKDGGGWYYQTITEATNNDGDAMKLLDILAKEVGVLGVFSDWPATVTYYANCMKLK
jgi:glycerophosphoryl diester phosphodiesterase